MRRLDRAETTFKKPIIYQKNRPKNSLVPILYLRRRHIFDRNRNKYGSHVQATREEKQRKRLRRHCSSLQSSRAQKRAHYGASGTQAAAPRLQEARGGSRRAGRRDTSSRGLPTSMSDANRGRFSRIWRVCRSNVWFFAGKALLWRVSARDCFLSRFRGEGGFGGDR